MNNKGTRAKKKGTIVLNLGQISEETGFTSSCVSANGLIWVRLHNIFL